MTIDPEQAIPLEQIELSVHEAASPAEVGKPRDAAFWAPNVTHLTVDADPPKVPIERTSWQVIGAVYGCGVLKRIVKMQLTTVCERRPHPARNSQPNCQCSGENARQIAAAPR